MEIYVNLKNVPKCPVTTNSNFKTVNNSKKSKTRTTGKSGNTFNSLASEIESFTEDIWNNVNNKLIWTVAEKFNQVEPKLYDCIAKSMNELGTRLQKSIDSLIQDNIFKLSTSSKRSKSFTFMRSGKKKKKAKSRPILSRTQHSEVEFKQVKNIDHIPTFYNQDIASSRGIV